MSMQGRAQFTPGPWQAERDTARNAYAWKVTGAKGVVEDIARLALVDSVSQIEANATLIAAAPAMYEALQNLLEWAKGNRGVKEGNPYCKPEVRQALKVLASIQGKKDYLDADTASQAEGRHHE